MPGLLWAEWRICTHDRLLVWPRVSHRLCRGSRPGHRLCPCTTASPRQRATATPHGDVQPMGRLPPGRQALLVLRHLREGENLNRAGRRVRSRQPTVFHYVRVGVDILAAVAPTLDQALDVARRKAFVILDGTLHRARRRRVRRTGLRTAQL